MEANQIQEPQIKPKNVFKYKNFTLCFLGALVSNMGNILYSFAVGYYILKLTDNNAFIQGAYLATAGIVFLIVTMFGGVIGDRFNKAKIMYICDYIKGGGLLLFTILLMLVIKDPGAKVVTLFIIAVFNNIIAGIFSPASASLLPKIVPVESIQQGQSYFTVMQSMNGIIGAILGAILYAILPINVLFLIVAICYILSAISEMFIKYDYVSRDDKLTIKGMFIDMGEGFKYIFKLKPLFYLLISVLFINFFVSPFGSNFIPFFVVTDIASSNYLFNSFISPEMWGSIIQIALSIGIIAGGIVLSTKQKKEHISPSLRIAFSVMSVVFILTALSYFLFNKQIFNINAILITFTIVCIVMGASIAAINIPIGTTILTIVDQDKIGKVQSVISVGSEGLVPLSEFLAGIVIANLGPSWLLTIVAAGFTLLTSFICFNKQIAKL